MFAHETPLLYRNFVVSITRGFMNSPKRVVLKSEIQKTETIFTSYNVRSTPLTKTQHARGV